MYWILPVFNCRSLSCSLRAHFCIMCTAFYLWEYHCLEKFCLVISSVPLRFTHLLLPPILTLPPDLALLFSSPPPDPPPPSPACSSLCFAFDVSAFPWVSPHPSCLWFSGTWKVIGSSLLVESLWCGSHCRVTILSWEAPESPYMVYFFHWDAQLPQRGPSPVWPGVWGRRSEREAWPSASGDLSLERHQGRFLADSSLCLISPLCSTGLSREFPSQPSLVSFVQDVG